MDRKTRVEKYKKLREDIGQMDTYKFDNPYYVEEPSDSLNDVGMSKEELQTEHIKKSTLSISIDQIVKAHNEYTNMVAQDKNKKEKETKKLQYKKLIFRLSIISVVILFVIVILLLAILLVKEGVFQ